MEFRQIESFLAVARTGSFSQAAKLLLLTQSAVSVQIRKLEAELQSQLFDRLGRRVQLTSAGEQFRPYAEGIHRFAEDAAFAVAGSPEGQRGTIRIGAPPSICAYFLPPVLKKFLGVYPHVKIVLEPDISSGVIERVQAATIDAGIVALPCNERRLAVEELFSDPLRLVVHPRHPLAGRRSVAVKDIANYPFISLDPHTVTGASIATILNASCVDVKVTLECKIFDIVKPLVQAGVGVSILPRSVVANECREGKMRALRLRGTQPTRRLALIRLRDRVVMPPLEHFVGLIRQAAGTRQSAAIGA